MRLLVRWTLVTAATLLLACSHPEHDEPPGGATRVSLEATEALELVSSFTGQTYRIDVALPHGYQASEADYPVLYLLDSDVLFGLVTDTARLLPLEEVFMGEGRVPAAIVVGIGYPGGVAEMSERRGWDFNPPEEVNPDGAANFFRFVSEQLVPRVEADYRTLPGDRTLVGASRGGVFVLSILFLHPETFQRYVAISPILDPAIFEYEEARASEETGLAAWIFLSAGDSGQLEMGIAAEVDRLTAVLESRAHPGLKLVTRSYEGESHASVLPRALVDGLVAVFAE